MSVLTVVAAAIQIPGKTFSRPPPDRHHNIIWSMSSLGYDYRTGVQGFMLSDGTFADRKRAVEVAVAAGQIVAPRWPPNLYSEDLW